MSTRGKVFIAFLIIAAGGVFGFAIFAPSGRSPEETASPKASPSATPDSSGISPTSTATAGLDDKSPPPRSPGTGGEQGGITTWAGPDDAVSTFHSKTCEREVLQFGEQQYQAGQTNLSKPTGVEDLGYHHGKRELWGDLGTPNTRYITEDGGKTFTQWLATDDVCSP